MNRTANLAFATWVATIVLLIAVATGAAVPWASTKAHRSAVSSASIGPDGRINRFDKCVVGANAAGMYAATLFKDKGYDRVLVLESAPEIGGLCHSYGFFDEQSGTEKVLDSAEIIYADTSAANALGCGPFVINTTALIERFAGPNSIAAPPFGTPKNSSIADFAHGIFYGPAPPPAPPTPAFIEAYVRFTTLLSTKYPWLDTLDIPDAIPPELLVPFGLWVIENNFTALYSLFTAFIFDIAYGPFNDTLAFYALMNMGCSVMNSPYLYLPGGCIQIYDGMRSYIGAENVRTSAHIELALRPPAGATGAPVVLIGTQGPDATPFVELCDDLVLGIIPTAKDVAFMRPDPLEQALYEHLFWKPYYNGVFNASGPVQNADPGMPWDIINADLGNFLDLPTSPCLYGVDQYIRTNGPTVYQGCAPEEITVEQMHQIIDAQLAGIPPDALTGKQQIASYLNRVDPYFDMAALTGSPNPYVTLRHLQGYRHVYNVGAVATFNPHQVWNLITVLLDQLFP